MVEHVMAIDPGGRTGWASADMSTDRLRLTGSGVLDQYRFALWLAREQSVSGTVTGALRTVPRHDVLVTESWKPRRKNGTMDWIEGDPLLSSQHVGQIRLIAALSGTRYVQQAPSQKNPARASYPLALRQLDERSSEQHDQDARLHLWGYFFKHWFSASVHPDETVVVIP